jgi:hypothetical protein
VVEFPPLDTVEGNLSALRGIVAARSYRTLTPSGAGAVAKLIGYCARRLQAAALKEAVIVKPQG